MLEGVDKLKAIYSILPELDINLAPYRKKLTTVEPSRFSNRDFIISNGNQLGKTVKNSFFSFFGSAFASDSSPRKLFLRIKFYFFFCISRIERSFFRTNNCWKRAFIEHTNERYLMK